MRFIGNLIVVLDNTITCKLTAMEITVLLLSNFLLTITLSSLKVHNLRFHVKKLSTTSYIGSVIGIRLKLFSGQMMIVTTGTVLKIQSGTNRHKI